MRYVILIPAFNAADTLAELIDQISALPEPPEKVIVIDDGSTDNTGASVADREIVSMKRLEVNQGKGGALLEGFRLACAEFDAEYILCMDADLQHPAASVPDFLRLAKTNNSRFIIGSRSRSFRNMPVHRILSNTITSWLISLMSRQRIKDSQCGYRLIHKEVLQGMELREKGFQFESEMIVKAARKGHRIDFVDIPTIYHAGSSHISNFRDTMHFIRWVLRESGGR